MRNNPLNNNAGFSLIQVVVAAGLLGTLSLMMTSVMVDSLKSAKTVEQNLQRSHFVENVTAILANEEACLATLGGKNPVGSGNPISVIKTDPDTDKFILDGTYGNDQVTLKSISIEEFHKIGSDDKIGESNLELRLLRAGFESSGGPSAYNAGAIKIYTVLDDDSKIIKCLSMAAVPNSLWSTVAGTPHINYSKGKVGIKTGDGVIPDADLDVNGTTILKQTLTVEGKLSATDNLVVTKSSFLGPVGINTGEDSITAGWELDVNGHSLTRGSSHIKQTLQVDQTAQVGQTLTVNGESTLAGKVFAKDDVDIDKQLHVKGQVTVDKKITSESTIANDDGKTVVTKDYIEALLDTKIMDAKKQMCIGMGGTYNEATQQCSFPPPPNPLDKCQACIRCNFTNTPNDQTFVSTKTACAPIGKWTSYPRGSLHGLGEGGACNIKISCE